MPLEGARRERGGRGPPLPCACTEQRGGVTEGDQQGGVGPSSHSPQLCPLPAVSACGANPWSVT